MKIKHKPQGTLIAALDLGSQKIACMIGRVVDDQGGIEIIGAGYHAAKGLKNGIVTDINLADQSIRQAVHSAEKMAAAVMKGYPLRDVVVTVPASNIRSDNVFVSMKLSGQSIRQKEMNQALARAQTQNPLENFELIHTIFMQCGLDENYGILDPIGMTGNIFEVSIHLVSVPFAPLENIARTIEKSHLDIVGLCSPAYASGLACLVEDEMNLGCTLIDIGANSTSLAIFQSGKMIYTEVIPLGGSHITNDIANGLSCAIADAERIKTLYGSAMVGNSDQNELIDISRIDDQEGQHHVTRANLIGIIQPRMEEILEMVRDRLINAPCKDVVSRKVVMTGGGSQLSGLRELAQLILDKQVRLGRPIRISHMPDAISGPAFATCAGLLTYYVSHEHEMPREISAQVDSASVWSRVQSWWRENW